MLYSPWCFCVAQHSHPRMRPARYWHVTLLPCRGAAGCPWRNRHARKIAPAVRRPAGLNRLHGGAGLLLLRGPLDLAGTRCARGCCAQRAAHGTPACIAQQQGSAGSTLRQQHGSADEMQQRRCHVCHAKICAMQIASQQLDAMHGMYQW